MSERVPDQPTCREVVELITDYLEARLPLEARTRLEQHLVFCDWCRVYLEQIGEPEDVGRAAVFLASDDSDYITGTSMYVDGGMTLYPEFASGG
jgi:NAD(P)-dependent dehydrogenase (short-subunit alcohol dehydrogenase family)